MKIPQATYLLFRILFGVIFIGSAVLKLFPIEAFEMILIKQVGISWNWAPLFARLMILLELTIGVSIAFGFLTRKMLWIAQGLTGFFTLYLLVLIAGGDGADNCGCFGELIPMDAPTSIAKNMVILAWGLALIWLTKFDTRWRFSWIGPSLGLLVVPIVFLALPLPSGDMDKEPTIDSELITQLNDEQNWDLLEEEKLIVALHASCVHCKQLATLLSTSDVSVANDRLRLMIYGKDEARAEFVQVTNIESFPFQPTESRALMIAAKGTFPTAIWMKNGEVASNWTGREVNMDLLSSILAAP